MGDYNNTNLIFGKTLLSGLGPGNTGAAIEDLVYSSTFDGYGFLERITPLNAAITYIETFENPVAQRVITAAGGTGGAAYGANGGLSLTTGTTASGAANALYNDVVSRTGGELELYDDLSGFIFEGDYTNLSEAAGACEFAIGVTDSTTLPTNATVTKGAWIYLNVTGGVTTVYACTANGSSVTATDITGAGPDFSGGRLWTILFVAVSGSLSSVTFHRGSESANPVATHTTNLPSGSNTNTQMWRSWISTGDTTGRTAELSNVTIKFGQ